MRQALNIARRRPTLALLAALSLSACTPDTESAFREEVSAWLSLGETRFFNATRRCTAAVFDVRSGILTSAMRSVTSWPEAQREIARGRPVAFETVTVSPSELTGAIMEDTPSLGTQFLSAGLAARNCMDAETEAAYFEALNQPDATLLFDPEHQTVGILRADLRLLFVGRGEL